jgi:hypothetical protein
MRLSGVEFDTDTSAVLLPARGQRRDELKAIARTANEKSPRIGLQAKIDFAYIEAFNLRVS